MLDLTDENKNGKNPQNKTKTYISESETFNASIWQIFFVLFPTSTYLVDSPATVIVQLPVESQLDGKKKFVWLKEEKKNRAFEEKWLPSGQKAQDY